MPHDPCCPRGLAAVADSHLDDTAALSRSDGAAAQVPVPVPTIPAPGVPAPGPVPQTLLKVGDTLRVDGAAMGCQVTRRGSRPVLECRRDGSLAGTYGTFMTDRRLTVARFRSSRTAQTISPPATAAFGGHAAARRGEPASQRSAGDVADPAEPTGHRGLRPRRDRRHDPAASAWPA